MLAEALVTTLPVEALDLSVCLRVLKPDLSAMPAVALMKALTALRTFANLTSRSCADEANPVRLV